MKFLNLLTVAAVFTVYVEAHAFSIWNRPSDDSVCDFSPWTGSRLTQKTNIPEGVPNEEEIYVRLALRVAANNCKNGQTLILHSAMGSDFDTRYFRTIANHLCVASDVKRSPVATKELPNAFEFRCKISKAPEAHKYIDEVEAHKPTEVYIRESYEQATSRVGAEATPGWPEKKSNKMCAGQVLGIGGGCQ